MAERPRFFEDIAGVAGGALSALAGLRDETEAMIRARVDETIRKLELVRREELDAVAELAARARAGQEAAEARLAALEARISGVGGEVRKAFFFEKKKQKAFVFPPALWRGLVLPTRALAAPGRVLVQAGR